MSLLVDPVKENKIRILEVEKYEDTYGPQKRRKRVKLNCSSLEEMCVEVEDKEVNYTVEGDKNIKIGEELVEKAAHRDRRMTAGQSPRIWEELYKVIDSSDVII